MGHQKDALPLSLQKQDWTHPFVLRAAEDEPRAVLVVHGFTGSPYEVHLLAQHLHSCGYHCRVPLLQGHHRTLAELTATGWTDWLASAEQALHELWTEVSRTAGTPRLAVVGLSMGGLLTLELARRYPANRKGGPAIAAISTLATPIFLSRRATRAIRMFHRTPGLRRLAVPKLFGADVRERNLPRPPLRPRAMPIRCLGSLLDLMAELRPRLGEVEQPALLCHGMRDHTAPYASMAAIAEGLGGADVRCLALPRSYHLLPLDVEREIVFAEVASHLARHL